MKLAETVTFGGAGMTAAALDRAHDLRRDAGALRELANTTTARTIVLWRGKVLVQGVEIATLAQITMDHPALTAAREGPIFLGRVGGDALWATDIGDWVPEGADLSGLGTFFDPSEQRHLDLPDDHRFAELRAMMTRLGPLDAECAATARALFGWHETHGHCARCGAATLPAMGGWQRDCPACAAHHFPRTDPVVIMLVTSGNDLLFGRSPGWPEGMYSLLAGFIEPGETLEAAVRREVFEESGVRVGPVAYLASQPWPFPASLMLGCHGEALSRDITIDPEELDDALWVSRERLALILAGADPVIKAPRSGAIAQFLTTNWLADRLD